MPKQNAIPIKLKMKILKELDTVGAINNSKSGICMKYGIPNSTLWTIIKDRDKITEIYENNNYEPDRKRMRTAKYSELEVALLIWFKQARSLNIPISGPPLIKKPILYQNRWNVGFMRILFG